MYTFPWENGSMAHHSYLSPDGRWVLIVEMDSEGELTARRVVPFAGGGSVRIVGPSDAACTSGGWSTDGKWLYVSSNKGGSFHIWRQRFPHGTPEQVTSGPTQEEGIAMTPDGQSMITSVGIQGSTVWVHDAKGEHQISSQGSAGAPQFSSDRHRLYYLVAYGETTDYQLWVADLDSGNSTPVLSIYSPGDCGVLGRHYSISKDETAVTFSMRDKAAHSHLWIASTSRKSAPHQIESSVSEGCPFFLPNGDLLFRAVEGASNFLYRRSLMAPSGTKSAVMLSMTFSAYPQMDAG